MIFGGTNAAGHKAEQAKTCPREREEDELRRLLEEIGVVRSKL